MATSYWQKLKDPRWQKRRLEILNKADFACELCCDKKQTLHVHHLKYDKGKEPWEYGDEWLACLCEACHEELHEAKQLLADATAGLSPDDLRRVAGYAFGLSGTRFELCMKGLARYPDASDYDSAEGVYDAIRGWLPREEGVPDSFEYVVHRFFQYGGAIDKRAIWSAFQDAQEQRRQRPCPESEQ